jgi:hypothetical protein
VQAAAAAAAAAASTYSVEILLAVLYVALARAHVLTRCLPLSVLHVCVYSWWHNAESYFLVGKAMGAGMLKALQA